jgi:hypothetical protein
MHGLASPPGSNRFHWISCCFITLEGQELFDFSSHAFHGFIPAVPTLAVFRGLTSVAPFARHFRSLVTIHLGKAIV